MAETEERQIICRKLQESAFPEQIEDLYFVHTVSTDVNDTPLLYVSCRSALYQYRIETKEDTSSGALHCEISKAGPQVKIPVDSPATNIMIDPKSSLLFCIQSEKINVFQVGSLKHLAVIDQSAGVSRFVIDQHYSTKNIACWIPSSKTIMIIYYGNFKFADNQIYKRDVTMKQIACDELLDMIYYNDKLFYCVRHGSEMAIYQYTDAKTDPEVYSTRYFPNQCFTLLPDEKDELLLLKIDETHTVVVALDSDFEPMPNYVPIEWDLNPSLVMVGFLFPYVIGVSASNTSKAIQFQHISSTSTATKLEPIRQLNTANHMTVGDKKLPVCFVSTEDRHIWVLQPPSHETQYRILLKALEFDTARRLFEHALISDSNASERQSNALRLELDIAFSLLFNFKFKKAFDAFYNIKQSFKREFDVRELLVFFKHDLLPEDQSYRPKRRDTDFWKHASLDHLPKKDHDSLRKAYEMKVKDAIVDYLERCRTLGADAHQDDELSCIDYALFVMYITRNQREKIENLLKQQNNLNYEAAKKFLTKDNKNHRYYALLARSKDKIQTALEILKMIGTGAVVEENEDGIRDTVDILSTSSDWDRIVKPFSQWVMEANPTAGIEIFTSSKRRESLPALQVVAHLEQYPSDLLQSFLEHLINNNRNEEKVYHTRLAKILADNILKIMPPTVPNFSLRVRAGEENGLVGEYRRKLRDHLIQSKHYDVVDVLEHIKKSILYDEMIVLYTKLTRYDEAIKVYVHCMKDEKGAELYCDEIFAKYLQEAYDASTSTGSALSSATSFLSLASTSVSSSQISKMSGGIGAANQGLLDALRSLNPAAPLNPLLIALLRICFYPEPPHAQNRSLAIRILNTRAKEIPAHEALELVPDDIPASELKPFLIQAIQSTAHMKRMTAFLKNTAISEKKKESIEQYKANKRYKTITPLDKCPVCRNRIGDAVPAVFPDMTLVHFKCFKNPHVHPITKWDFKSFPWVFKD